ncbi:MAG: Spy/CpxP family protein refolding chaperone [Pseudomonadales bacterium]
MKALRRGYRSRYKLSAALLMSGLLSAGLAYASDGLHAQRLAGFVAYMLDFSDEQQAKLRDIQQELQSIRDETQAYRQRHREEARQMLQADTLDVERIQQLMEQHHRQAQKYAPRLLPLIAELHATLTQAQKDKIDRHIGKDRDGGKYWHRFSSAK